MPAGPQVALQRPPRARGRSPLLRVSLSSTWSVVAIVLPAILVTAQHLDSVDLSYHIRLGGQMIDAHTLIRTDTLGFFTHGASWLDQQWGAQVLFAWTFRAGSWFGLAALRALLSVAISWWIFLACRQAGLPRRRSAWLTLASIVLLSTTWVQLRPQLFGLAIFACCAWLVVGRHAHPRRLYAIIPLAALWANLHGSFFLAPLILCLAAAQDRTYARASWLRTLAVAGGAVLATFANPFGPRVWSYLPTVAGDPIVRHDISEWQATSARSPLGLLFLVSVAFVVVFLVGRGGTRRWSALVGLGLFAAGGLAAYRGIPWWYLAAPVLLAWFLAPEGDDRDVQPDPTNGLNAVICAALVLGLVASLARWAPYADGTIAPRLLAFAPQGIARAIDASVTPGEPILAPQAWGSWLEFAAPTHPVVVDSRIELIPGSVWRAYRDITEGRQGWQTIIDRWGIGVVVVSPRFQPELVPRIRSDPGWQLIYEDADGLIFIRRR